MQKHWKRVVIGAIALVALVIAVFYAFVLLKDDAPEKLDSDSRDSALATTTSAGEPPETTAVETAASPDGDWVIVGDASTVGYRIQEVLAGVDVEAAGRTDQVTGSLTILGTQATAGEFSVDMATIVSDDGRRDGQFRGRIMNVDQFPTATFVLTSPIDFGAVPLDGSSVVATASGELTLRGVTRPVTFEVDARLEGGRIGVLGSIPILFSDYQIPDPSNAVAKVKDDGLLEFVLIFDRV
jgi:polyisoprenoid-binding protein YceI